MLKKLFLTTILFIFLAGCVFVGWVYTLVVVHPGNEISETNIAQILGRERPCLL